MTLHLSDIEANATKHALEDYLKTLSSGGGDIKATEFETKAVQSVIAMLSGASGAPGT